MSPSPSRSAQASLHALAHDLRGPVLTIDGFATELRLATEDLVRLVSDGTEPDTPDGGRGEPGRTALEERVLDIATTDLLPCLECIAAAAATLGARIDALDGAGES